VHIAWLLRSDPSWHSDTGVMDEAESDCCGSMGPSARRAVATGSPCAAGVVAVAVVAVVAAAAAAAEEDRGSACWAEREIRCSPSGWHGTVLRAVVVVQVQGRSIGRPRDLDLEKGKRSDLDSLQADATDHRIVGTAAWTSMATLEQSRSAGRGVGR